MVDGHGAIVLMPIRLATSLHRCGMEVNDPARQSRAELHACGRRIGRIEAVLRGRAGAYGPRRAADGGRQSRRPSGWTSRAAPWGTRLPRTPSHDVRGRGVALLALAA